MYPYHILYYFSYRMLFLKLSSLVSFQLRYGCGDNREAGGIDYIDYNHFILKIREPSSTTHLAELNSDLQRKKQMSC